MLRHLLPYPMFRLLYRVEQATAVDDLPPLLQEWGITSAPVYRARLRPWVRVVAVIVALMLLVALVQILAPSAHAQSTGHHAGGGTPSYLIERGQARDAYISPGPNGSYCGAVVCWHPGQQRAWVLHFRTGPNATSSTPWNYTTGYPISGSKGANINDATRYVRDRMVQDYGSTYRVDPSTITSRYVPRGVTTGGYRAPLGAAGYGACASHVNCPLNK